MKSKKTLFSIIGLSVIAVMLNIVLVTPGDTYPGYYSSEKSCGSADSSDCGNLPCLGALLHKKGELGLNDDQVAKLKKLKSSSKKAKIRTSADIQILEIEFKELLDEKSVDKKAVESKIDAIGNLRTQIIKDCVNTKLTARELLTNEQLEKLEKTKKSCDKGTKTPSGNEDKTPQGSSTKNN